MKKSKNNKTLQNLIKAHRICILNNKDEFTIQLLEKKIAFYKK